MQILPSRRELRQRHWRNFGRPILVAILTAMALGLSFGVLWTLIGLWHFHPLW